MVSSKIKVALLASAVALGGCSVFEDVGDLVWPSEDQPQPEVTQVPPPQPAQPVPPVAAQQPGQQPPAAYPPPATYQPPAAYPPAVGPRAPPPP